MANIVVFTLSIVLFIALLLVKGGAVTHVFLAWSGVSIVSALFLQSWAMKSDAVTKVSFWKSSNVSFTMPICLMLLLQCWLALQIVFGISQDLQSSIDDALLGLGFLSFLIVLASLKWSLLTMKYFLFSVFMIASMQAVYGLWVFLTQSNVILWMEKIHYLDKPTGTFVNANHFAAYLSLIFVLLIAFMACKQQQQIRHQNTRQTIFNLFEQLYSVFAICGVTLLVAILATRSFGGIGSLLVTILVALAVLLKQKISQKVFRRELIILSCMALMVLLIVFLIIAFSDYSILQKEFDSIAFTIERRLEISTAALRMVADNWLLGVGAGGFYSSFSQYRDITVGNSFYHFAHNDYLQFWAEYGLIGVMLCVAFVATCLHLNWKILQQSKNVYRRSFAYASFYGTVLLGIHSLVDFPLQVPAYALLYLTILCFNVMTYKEKS